MADEKSSDKASTTSGGGEAVKATTTVTTTAGPSKGGSASGSGGSSQRSGKSTDSKRAHPMQGKSLDYVSGPGAESYQPGVYDSDRVNEEEHLKVHFDR